MSTLGKIVGHAIITVNPIKMKDSNKRRTGVTTFLRIRKSLIFSTVPYWTDMDRKLWSECQMNAASIAKQVNVASDYTSS